MNWSQKILKRYLKEAWILSLFSITFVLIIIIANQFFGWSFEWKEIDIIDQPAPLIRIFYSALAYISIGAISYHIGFYYWLYQIFWGFLWNYRLYKDIKKLIWTWNILIMYFIIVPWVINMLNFTISLFLNSYQIFIQSLPLLGISFGVTSICILSYIYIVENEPTIIGGISK